MLKQNNLSEIQVLHNLPFWDALTKKEQDFVKKQSIVRTYEAGSIIHSREQECLGLIHVLSGRARAFMLSEEGRQITLYEVNENEIDVLSASCVVSQITFETQLIADTDCEVQIVPAVCMADLKENNLSARCFIYEMLGERFSDAMHVMQDMLFMPLDRRIAAVLIATEKDNKVSVTHEELAAKINSSREVISRALKQMEKEGLLALSRGKIKLLNKEQIKKLSKGLM